MTTLSSSSQKLLEIVMSRSMRDGAAFVLDQLDAGWAPATLLTDVLVPVQVEVGERWQRNEMTVTDEHVATAVVDNALATLAMTAPASRVRDRGTVAVVCAQGDWHTLPARMASELWRWEGWDVLFLGGSLPPADLTRWLRSARPDVLAVTCSVAMFAPGVLRLADGAADAGVSCVVGGGGLGTDARRANALGVRWAASPAGLDDALNVPRASVDPDDLNDRRVEAEALTSTVGEVVEAALRALADALPAVRDYTPQQVAHTRQDYRLIVAFLASAVLCDDSALFTGFLGWLQSVLTTRGLPPDPLRTGIAALADVLPERYRRARLQCGEAAVGHWHPTPANCA